MPMQYDDLQIVANPPAKAKEKLDRGIVQMLFKHPFYAQILCNLNRVAVTGTSCPRFALSKTTFFYNVDFVESLSADEITYCLASNALEVVYDVVARGAARDNEIWPYASEYAINQDLRQTRVGEMPSQDKVKLAYDDKYREMSTYQIYESLEKDPNRDRKLKNVDLLTQPVGGGNDPGESPITIDTIMNALQGASTDSLPPSLRALYNEFTNPKISWRRLLRTDIRSLHVSDYTLIRPNRKSWQLGAILPGTIGFDRLEIAISIDVSGSVSEPMVRDMLSEVKGIAEEFDDYELTVWMFDTQIHNMQKFTPSNIDELADYKIMGGGGTDLDVNWRYMEEMQYVPDRFLLFTDAYCGNDRYRNREDYCDTIFLIFGNTNFVPPFGMHLNYELES